MFKFSVRFVFYLLQTLIYILTKSEKTCLSNVKIKYGVSIVGNTISNFTNIGFKMCVKECHVTKSCNSVDFYRNTYFCELKSKSLNETTDILNDVNIWHVDIENDRSLLVGEDCTSSCSDGQKCVSRWCVPLECPDPPIIKYAIASTDKRSFGTTITSACFTGYIARGSTNITCSSRGVWSESSNNLVCYKTTDSWILVARFKSEIGVKAYDTWFSTGDASETDMSVEVGCTSMNYSSTCTKHYRSGLIDEWDTLGVTEVKIELFKLGVLVANITFNGVNTTERNWLSRANYIDSGWSDLADPQQTYNFYSIEGDSSGFRRFYINHDYNGCSADVGWMVSVERFAGCNWESPVNIPKFLYSPLSTYGYSWADMVTADVMVISIKALNFP